MLSHQLDGTKECPILQSVFFSIYFLLVYPEHSFYRVSKGFLPWAFTYVNVRRVCVIFFPTFTVGIPTISCVGTYQTIWLVFVCVQSSNIRMSKFIPKSFIWVFRLCLAKASAEAGTPTQSGRLRSVSGTSASQGKERWSEEYISRPFRVKVTLYRSPCSSYSPNPFSFHHFSISFLGRPQCTAFRAMESLVPIGIVSFLEGTRMKPTSVALKIE